MGKHWTTQEVDTFREMYNTHSIHELCSYFGKKKTQIYDKARHLKINRPSNWRSDNCPYPNNTATRFKKGHQSWNKGLKLGSDWAKATQFKKGQVPHNKLPEELRELTVQLSKIKKSINEKIKRRNKNEQQ